MKAESIKKPASERRGAENVGLERSVQGAETKLTSDLQILATTKKRRINEKTKQWAYLVRSALGR